MASTDLPTMNPMPIPGPTAPRPYPMSPTLPPRAATMPTTAPTRCSMLLPFLVLGAHRAGDVNGGQDREHVRLQQCHEDLEAGEEDRHEQRGAGEQDGDRRLQQVRGPEIEDDEQQMPGEQVGEEPQRQRE